MFLLFFLQMNTRFGVLSAVVPFVAKQSTLHYLGELGCGTILSPQPTSTS